MKNISNNNFLWSFFSSIHLSVVILLSLAVTSIFGTIIPQNENIESYTKIFGISFTNFFYHAGFFDIYHSILYQTLLLMLLLNIVICSLNRLPLIWKIVFNDKFVFHPAKFKSVKIKQNFIINDSLNSSMEHIKNIFSKYFKNYLYESKTNGFYLFGEKGRFSRLGAYGVHISILFMIAGGIIGSLWGFEAFVNIPEGESISKVYNKNNSQEIGLDFSIRCDDFSVKFYESGQPEEYKSRLTIIENNKEILSKSIVVNDPLRYIGINIFQSSYGQISGEFTARPPDNIEIQLQNNETGMIYMVSGSLNKEIKLPEASGSLLIKDYFENTQFHGHDLGPTLVVHIKNADKKKIDDKAKDDIHDDIMIPIKYANFDKMRGGYFQISVANTQDFKNDSDEEKKYYTGLQITKDPGVWFVYTGFLIMLIGIYITFFMAHERVIIEVVQEEENVKVFVAGTTTKNKLAMQQKVQKICARIKSKKN